MLVSINNFRALQHFIATNCDVRERAHAVLCDVSLMIIGVTLVAPPYTTCTHLAHKNQTENYTSTVCIYIYIANEMIVNYFDRSLCECLSDPGQMMCVCGNYERKLLGR